MKKYKDFDRMFAEMQGETIPFIAFGEEYQIKKQIPAWIPLEMSSYDDDHAMPAKTVFRAARMIFGEKQLSKLCENPDFTMDKLEIMLRWAFEAIQGKDEAEEAEEVTEDTMAAVPEKN